MHGAEIRYFWAGVGLWLPSQILQLFVGKFSKKGCIVVTIFVMVFLNLRVLSFKEILERGLATGSRKAKCRIVVLGFEDDRAVEEGLTTDAPTVSRLGGRVVAMIITGLGWDSWP